MPTRVIDVRDAVGTRLAHDITKIKPGNFKGCYFKKGHLVREEDIPDLLDLGKEHVYVLDIKDDEMHEDDAVLLLARSLAGRGVSFDPSPSEGKISFAAASDGLLKVDVEALESFNLLGEVMCATRHTNSVVKEGDVVGGTRAIPLVVKRDLINKAAEIADSGGGTLEVMPLRSARASLLITGNEVYTGRIEDAFEPILREKLTEMGSQVLSVAKCPDDVGFIAGEIRRARQGGADLIILTGGMSVDPDDVTRMAVEAAGAEITAYGSAVLPGAMFMAAYMPADSNGFRLPVLGVPACGIYHKRTIFDLVLPRVLAGEVITRAEIARLGHGGLCLECEDCRFPVCPFGKAC